MKGGKSSVDCWSQGQRKLLSYKKAAECGGMKCGGPSSVQSAWRPGFKSCLYHLLFMQIFLTLPSLIIEPKNVELLHARHCCVPWEFGDNHGGPRPCSHRSLQFSVIKPAMKTMPCTWIMTKNCYLMSVFKKNDKFTLYGLCEFQRG